MVSSGGKLGQESRLRSLLSRMKWHRRICGRVPGVAGDTLGATVKWRPRDGSRVKRPGCALGVRGGNYRHRRVSRRVSSIAGDTLEVPAWVGLRLGTWGPLVWRNNSWYPGPAVVGQEALRISWSTMVVSLPPFKGRGYPLDLEIVVLPTPGGQQRSRCQLHPDIQQKLPRGSRT